MREDRRNEETEKVSKVQSGSEVVGRHDELLIHFAPIAFNNEDFLVENNNNDRR